MPIDDAYAPAGDDSAGDAGRWQVHRLRGEAGSLLAHSWPPGPSAWVLDVVEPALVLGSTQPAVPGAVRRRSGGGAVLLEPGSVLWVDVVVPRGDPLWLDDVGRAFLWLGEVWAEAIGDDAGAAVHLGPLVRTRWSDAACFAGLGPGEVTVGGRKVVGISQRRTREAALFQCAALRSWDDGGATERALGLPAGVLAGAAAAVDVTAEAFLLSLARR